MLLSKQNVCIGVFSAPEHMNTSSEITALGHSNNINQFLSGSKILRENNGLT